MNRIQQVFKRKKNNVLNIYFTAGYPQLDDTTTIIKALAEAQVDIIELGIPYSDPLADGLTIQESSSQALQNGINLNLIFDQLSHLELDERPAIVMMGYYNQFLQFGMDRLIIKAKSCGIDGFIIPDLPMDQYNKRYKDSFEKAELGISFLITPETSVERIKLADKLTSGFLYVVAQSSITGNVKDITLQQKQYFERIKDMNLKRPKLIGFGIHDKGTFNNACQYAEGAIIGSAFIRDLKKHGTQNIATFVNNILT